MISRVRFEIRLIFASFLIFWLVFVSGAVLFHNNNRIYLLVTASIIILVPFFTYKQFTVKVLPIFFISVISIYAIISMLWNGDTSNFFPYFGIILRIWFVFIVATSIKYREFTRLFSDIVLLLSVSSLVFYILGISYPSIALGLPIIKDASGSLYLNAWIYVYKLPLTVGVLSRNYSVFWEPGAYQALLNLGLFLEIQTYGLKRTFRIVIFIVTIITTLSTSGYIILLLIVAFFIYPRIKATIYRLVTIMVTITTFIIAKPLLDSVLLDKLSMDSGSFSRRYSDFIVDLAVAASSPFLGVGYLTYYKQFEKIMGDAGSSSSNSITASIAFFGFFAIMYVLSNYLLYAKSMTKSKTEAFALVLILVVVFSTENFLFAPVWLILPVYGLSLYKRNRRSYYGHLHK